MRADEDVRSDASPPQRLVRQTATTPFGLRVIWDYHQQVIVAVGSSVATRHGAEKINPLRLIRARQTAHHLGKRRVVGGRCPESGDAF